MFVPGSARRELYDPVASDRGGDPVIVTDGPMTPSPAVVLEWLERRFPTAWLTLPAAATRRGLRTAVDCGIRGGELYDALIAATAAHHKCTLVSADRRAAPVYVAVGVDVVYLASE